MGGLEHYVQQLKEMVFLPLLYPELFERFKVQPPRGVLFYGPPGTGERRGGAWGDSILRGGAHGVSGF